MNCLGLASYDSDSDSASDVDERHESPGRNPPTTEASAAVSRTEHSGYEPKLTGKRAFESFGSRSVRKKSRNATLPMFSKPVAADESSSEDDETTEERRRRAKAQQKVRKAGALSFLPDPMNAIPIKSSVPEDFFSVAAPMPASADLNLAPSHDPDAVPAAELYRVNDDGQYIHTAQGQSDEQSSAAWRDPTAEDLLTRALQAEREKARSLGHTVGGAGLEIKEISAEAVQHVAPHERAEMDAIRTAMGSEYVQKIREETSGKNQPTKLAKRRHQITSLYVHARKQELDDMERKAKGAKLRAETQSKYGW